MVKWAHKSGAYMITRDELEKQKKTDLIDLVLQQQAVIDDLQARLARIEIAQVRMTSEKTHTHVSRHRRRKSFDRFKKTYMSKVLIIFLGIILTILIVMAMNGYLWILIYRLAALIINIF
jgi:hypothetical protein